MVLNNAEKYALINLKRKLAKSYKIKIFEILHRKQCIFENFYLTGANSEVKEFTDLNETFITYVAYKYASKSKTASV